jgi:hypothetical protein
MLAGREPMRVASEYIARAREFEARAADAMDAALKRRYADLAACYRLLAAECERVIATAATGSKDA